MRKMLVVSVMGLLLISPSAWAEDKAAPVDVYRLVVNAYEVVKILGDDALPAFNNSRGEFVFKDTYVYVLQCPAYMAAHPYAFDKLKGMDLREKYPFQNTLCDGGKSPYGQWVEYHWPKPGGKDPMRKIAFTIHVDGTPYTVCAGIYDEKTDISGLNKTLKKQ